MEKIMGNNTPDIHDAAAVSPKPDQGHGQHTVEITVNEQKVKLQKPQDSKVTGAAIKAAAIAEGVAIQPNFVLQEELPNGTSRIVGDNDEVYLRAHLRFTAIAPDDNS